MYFNITLLNKLSTSRTIPQPFFRQFFVSGPCLTYERCDLPCEFPNCLRSHRDAKFVPDAPIEKSLLATLAECRLEQLVALLRHWSVEVDTTLDKMGVRLLVGPRNGAAVVGRPRKLVHVPESFKKDPRGIIAMMITCFGGSVRASREDAVIRVLDFMGLDTTLSYLEGEESI